MSRPAPPPSLPLIRVLLWALGIIVVLGAGYLLFFPSPPSPPAEAPPPRRAVTLYFAAADGAGLVAEGREVAGCLVEIDCLKNTVQALLDGPVGALAPVFPPGAGLSGIVVTDSEVQIDFTRSLVDSHPGGSWGELLTVYALTNTVAVNFPHLRQVRILIEGAAVETLKGHVDLRQPLNPDFRLLVKAADGQAPAPPVETPR
jgi:spore germination protein GerM